MNRRPSRIRAHAICLVSLFLACATPLAAYPGNASPDPSTGGLAQNAEVLETMNAGGYTYVRILTPDGEIWAAGPERSVAVGDHVNLGDGAMMPQFHSKSLERTFDAIYFVGDIEVVGSAGSPHGAAQAGGGHGTGPTATKVAAGSIAKPDGGWTIAELYARGGANDGATVLVRGQVVKFTPDIMGRNWIHIQDGTGATGTNDLTVTSKDAAKPGDVVLVRGVAATDKDFGAGYRYDLIVEEATVTVE